ncbi:hypothetical protein ABFS82_12G086900 [Erythranthe guttata]
MPSLKLTFLGVFMLVATAHGSNCTSHENNCTSHQNNCTTQEDCDRLQIACLEFTFPEHVYCVHRECQCKTLDECALYKYCGPVANTTPNPSSDHAPTATTPEFVGVYVLLLQLVYFIFL